MDENRSAQAFCSLGMDQPVGLERFEISGANLPAMKDRPAKGQGVFAFLGEFGSSPY